jgi:hypothetical protein
MKSTADGRAAAADHSLISECAAVAGERCHPDKHGDLFAIEPPQFGEVREECATHDGTNARHGAELFSFARQAGLFWMVSSRLRSTAAMRRSSQRICRVDFSTDRRRGMLHATPLGGELSRS